MDEECRAVSGNQPLMTDFTCKGLASFPSRKKVRFIDETCVGDAKVRFDERDAVRFHRVSRLEMSERFECKNGACRRPVDDGINGPRFNLPSNISNLCKHAKSESDRPALVCNRVVASAATDRMICLL